MAEALSTQKRGMKPESLAKIILAVLILALLGLAYYYFVVLPRMGGGIVEQERLKIGKIEFLSAIYGPGTKDMPYFTRPMGVATDKFENIYVTDADNNQVCVFSKNGRFLFFG